MEARDFLVKLKSSAQNFGDLEKFYRKTKLATKDRGTIALSVLCLLCRNIDKEPTWRATINNKDLLTLAIECIRETRGLNKADQVKTLACIYHIHKYVIKKNTEIPPELILKLSYMAFDAEPKYLLKEYCKTYWNIIVDRISYIESIKTKAINKLLPKLTEDIIKTLDIYNTVEFAKNITVYLTKKLHYLYSESYYEQLNSVYGEIFKFISNKSDLNAFKKLKDSEVLELYVKHNECLYVIAENASKNKFKDSALNIAVRSGIAMFGHQPDMFHCLQTFYSNSFCDIFENKSTYLDAVFKNLTISCEVTEKLGYKETLVATYPFLNQFLRLFVEFSVKNSIQANFSESVQENCLNFLLKLLEELKNCEQLLKCENCPVRSPLHDCLRLSFLIKHFISTSVNLNIGIDNLIVLYKKVIDKQYEIMAELKKISCSNYEKCFWQLQTDTHNTAILLHKSEKYEISIELFEIYINNELKINAKDFEHKNVARAFYNKSICELNFNKHEKALLDAFLALIFAKDLKTDKYMHMVMDIKGKALKYENDDEDCTKNDEIQLMTALDACQSVMKRNMYNNLMGHVENVKFSVLLKHEFEAYSKLWPSVIPIAGVWRSLYSLLNGTQEQWITAEDKDAIFWTLLEVISLTPNIVKTIHIDYNKSVVRELLEMIEKMPEPLSSDVRVAQTILLFLRAEFDIADASIKYGWKITDPSTDPDAMQSTRTISQEHKALQKAIQAVEIWTELAVVINTVTKRVCLISSVRLCEMFVQQLLQFDRQTHALQLAHVCCVVATYIGDKEIFIRNAGVLLYHMDKPSTTIQDIIHQAIQNITELNKNINALETVIIFICDASIYYNRIGSFGTSAKLLQLAQCKILKAYEENPDINLELAVGRLMEAQSLLCIDSGPTAMTAVNGTQRHYLSIVNTATKWLPRRLYSLTLKYHISTSSTCAVYLSRSLRAYRRASSACVAAWPGLQANTQAKLVANIVNTYNMDDAQVKIDNRLKYILDLLATTQDYSTAAEKKVQVFAPKQDLEVMLENQVSKIQLSPTRKYVPILGYLRPEFFDHINCDCFACSDPNYALLCYSVGGLEASMYFRANEFEIAANYFKGVIKTFDYFDGKLKSILKSYSDLDFENYIIDFTKSNFEDQFRKIKLEILIEAAYFELRNNNFDTANEYIVNIYEINQDLVKKDGYLENEIMNLVIASARMTNVAKKKELDIEIDFENLKITPENELAKTPEGKSKLPPFSTKKLKDEELPKKRRVIALNLDEDSSDEKEFEKPTRKPRKPKAEFKIPVPVTTKPVLEAITPRVTRKPEIIVTEPVQTPKTDTNNTISEFFTPQSTPEQFFTPLNTIKTYSKSNLRRGIVKNLENEFSTPRTTSERTQKNLEVSARSSRKEEKNKTLKRATSPGKLVESQTRPRRLRQPKINCE